MPAEWTGDLVKKMHLNRVSNTELAAEMGVTKNYVGMLINGVRDASKLRETMEAALERIIERKAAIN